MEYGLSDGISRMWDAARRIVTGYDPEKYPEDKTAKENLEKAVETPTSEIIAGVGFEQVLLYVGMGLLIFLALKD